MISGFSKIFVFVVLTTISLKAWSEVPLDWGSLAEIRESADTPEQKRASYLQFLQTSPIIDMGFETTQQIRQLSASDRDRIFHDVDPLLIDVAIEQMVLHFPFPTREIAWCEGILCSRPLYGIRDMHNSPELVDWVKALQWYRDGGSVPRANGPQSRTLIAAYMIVNYLYSVNPSANWGSRPQDDFMVVMAMKKTLLPVYFSVPGLYELYVEGIHDVGGVGYWPHSMGTQAMEEALDTLKKIRIWREQLLAQEGKKR